jgi:hypothetical protein
MKRVFSITHAAGILALLLNGFCASTLQADEAAERAERKRADYLEHAARHDQKAADRQWNRTAERQAMVDQILARKSEPAGPAMFQGRPLVELLRVNGQSSSASLQELLSLKPVVTGEEPQMATFELPISYRALTNVGKLLLLVDPVEGSEDAEAIRYRCIAGANGNCRITWQTDFDRPGKHALQAAVRLRSEDKKLPSLVKGPMLAFVSSNVCQYSESSSHFDPELGAVLLAKILEPNASYRVEFVSPEGERIRTLTKTTTNSVIKVMWDLADERGQRFSGDAFDTVFHVTLASDGKVYTQKGP